jgi:hypothetical protein
MGRPIAIVDTDAGRVDVVFKTGLRDLPGVLGRPHAAGYVPRCDARIAQRYLLAA